MAPPIGHVAGTLGDARRLVSMPWYRLIGYATGMTSSYLPRLTRSTWVTPLIGYKVRLNLVDHDQSAGP